MSNKAAKKKQTSFKSPASEIPTPFTKAPASIEPLLEQLDPAKVYITHIDRFSTKSKQQIFLIPVILNAVIAGLLVWRLWYAVPTYWTLVQTFIGYTTPATVNPDTTTRGEQFTILFKRTGMIMLDYLLFRFMGPWPLTFFLEQPANPVAWRMALGFKKEEVAVRVSRHWGAEELMQGIKQGEENPFFKTRILPAIDKQLMRSKTAYLMMDSSWDLDFQSILDAHTLIGRDQLNMKDIDKLVIVNMQGVGWLAWKWETDSDVIEDRRKKIIAFKDTLTKMGKEGLFFRWMEIVEQERDGDGGFSAAKQERVMERVRAAFEKEGIDFEELSKSIGGLQELPTQVNQS
ncbi:hypothetical protein KC316_g14014 [Hortaea werneckii]|nr:hypothetical protein KC334_g7241 [Hortaea werneckii]KAI6967837.1 hypothetical protein KC355_g12030 [Hortaea werneckii]KAI7156906.1 hypothetical protein KC324_g13983 [Hortaea werneckii]KAI7227040.1 hypothetical protein KC330_g8578 [Hortaea werneckii]KAI7553106.1 hypothetical protein KC316_g14014 [Hortaea werneckii]